MHCDWLFEEETHSNFRHLLLARLMTKGWGRGFSLHIQSSCVLSPRRDQRHEWGGVGDVRLLKVPLKATEDQNCQNRKINKFSVRNSFRIKCTRYTQSYKLRHEFIQKC